MVRTADVTPFYLTIDVTELHQLTLLIENYNCTFDVSSKSTQSVDNASEIINGPINRS